MYRRQAGNEKTIERLMKKHLMTLTMLCAPLFSFAQVGIGTTTPNVKAILDLSSTSQGLIIPRLTSTQKIQIQPTADEAGMLIFQTDISSRGLYYFDGSNWVAPIPNGTNAGQTMKWDGTKWTYASNLFNQGTSIGIGTTSPANQLHIQSAAAAYTRLQLTNNTTGTTGNDGLLVGVAQSNGHAHLLQNENKPLWMGTSGVERMRIDSAGNVGIGRTNPAATLDVNGTVKIGANGSIIHSILKQTVEVQIPAIEYGSEGMVEIPFANCLTDGAVYVSPASSLSGLMISYARVCTPGNVEVKFMNMNPEMEEPMTMTFHISVIQ